MAGVCKLMSKASISCTIPSSSTCTTFVRFVHPRAKNGYRMFVPGYYDTNQRYEVKWETAQPLEAKDVVDRYYRLNNGLFIHAQPARYRRQWKHRREDILQLQKHIFATEEDQEILDQMLTMKYRKKKYYVDNIYEPYESKSMLPEYAGIRVKKYYP